MLDVTAISCVLVVLVFRGFPQFPPSNSLIVPRLAHHSIPDRLQLVCRLIRENIVRVDIVIK
jgi:hypothetical protein